MTTPAHRLTAALLLLMAAARSGHAAEGSATISTTPLLLKHGGTVEKPAVYDGQGVVIDLGIDVTGQAWKKDGDLWTSDGPLLGRAPLKAGHCGCGGTLTGRGGRLSGVMSVIRLTFTQRPAPVRSSPAVRRLS